MKLEMKTEKGLISFIIGFYLFLGWIVPLLFINDNYFIAVVTSHITIVILITLGAFLPD